MLRSAAISVALAAAYFAAGKLGLALAFVHASATGVWPPTGIAIAAFLIFGYWLWPAVFAAAFLVNVTTAGSVATSLGIALGNTLEGLIAASLVNRFAGGLHAFEHAGSTFKYTLFAGLMSTTVSPIIGVSSLALGGYTRWSDYGSIWTIWWLGDAVGALVVAPALILWTLSPHIQGGRARIAEALALLGCLALIGRTVFDALLPFGTHNFPLEFLCFPVFLWAAFRFGPREVATGLVVLSAIAIAGTLRGEGPFARHAPNEALILLQSFTGVTAVMSLAVAAVVSERKGVEDKMRRLAVSDPLTGLANYRQLVEVLDVEIKRAERTGRLFAVLFLDLDGLKKINDQHGHITGSRALCRVADAIRLSSRNIDTPARFGGDEFALVLPETDETGAQGVGMRIHERVAADLESPTLSVSIGIAVYRRDAATADGILASADRSLYDGRALARSGSV